MYPLLPVDPEIAQVPVMSQAGAYQGCVLDLLLGVSFCCVLGVGHDSRPWPRFQFACLRFESLCIPLSVKTCVLELRFEFCDLRSRTMRFGAAC